MKKHRYIAYSLVLSVLFAVPCALRADQVFTPGACKVLNIAKVWSGHPVGFYLLTHGNQQFVAYYDENRVMTIAQRTLDSEQWTRKALDSKVGWDSHNYITMAIDSDGILHISGNMHGHKLVYFRSTKSLDVNSIEPVHHMIGNRENSVTYPVFMNGPDGQLIYNYRDGSSGKGDNIFNVYDTKTKTWKRLMDQPLMDGKGKMNAYMSNPMLGPDGYYHVVWVWRDTPAAETCHDLSYIRSRDLVHWENAQGQALNLPITYADNSKVAVDPIPAGGGIINGISKVGFLPDQSLAVTYQKYDAEGNSQIYLAQPTADGWKTTQMTRWDYRWEFKGYGSLPFEIRSSGVMMKDGKLTIDIVHKKFGSGCWEVDPATFQLVKKVPDTTPRFVLPSELNAPVSTFPGITVRQAADSGKSPDGRFYGLRWETLGVNQDRPRPEPWPEASMLQLIEQAPAQQP